MKILLEKEAEEFLEKNNFNVVKRAFAARKSQLNRVKINFPWVMKVYSKKIIHKTKVGGVIMPIKSLKEAEKAFDKLSRFEGFEGVVIQEIIFGQKIILGLKNTEEFGMVIMLGAGGSDVEKLRDVSFRIIPASERDIENMFEDIEIKIAELNFVKKSLIQLSKFAEKNLKIQELDINPLIVNKSGAFIADARIVFS